MVLKSLKYGQILILFVKGAHKKFYSCFDQPRHLSKTIEKIIKAKYRKTNSTCKKQTRN